MSDNLALDLISELDKVITDRDKARISIREKYLTKDNKIQSDKYEEYQKENYETVQEKRKGPHRKAPRPRQG